MTDMQTDLTLIEHLDFDFEQPCEHSWHGRTHADEPAMYEVERDCPNCGTRRFFLCHSGWVRLGTLEVCMHAECGYRAPRDELLTIVRMIGGAP